MIDPGWRVEEPDPDNDPAQGSPLPTLASLDFLRGALRRRWPVWVIAALLGLLAGIAFNQAVPPKSSASVTVLLAHDPQQDPTRAMATDVSLLGTRAVAQQVIDRLHLNVSPDDFLKSVTAHAATDQVLVVNATGPDDAAAVARAQALAEGFLRFRARQLNDQTDVLVKGYNQRVATLQAQVATLTQRIDELSKGGANDGTAAAEAIDQRRQINAADRRTADDDRGRDTAQHVRGGRQPHHRPRQRGAAEPQAPRRALGSHGSHRRDRPWRHARAVPRAHVRPAATSRGGRPSAGHPGPDQRRATAAPAAAATAATSARSGRPPRASRQEPRGCRPCPGEPDATQRRSSRTSGPGVGRLHRRHDRGGRRAGRPCSRSRQPGVRR